MCVRVCSFVKGSASFFVEIAWMIIPRMWLPRRRSVFETTEGEKRDGAEARHSDDGASKPAG